VISERPLFWFPRKRYGWGWALPVRWQGWLAYAALLYAGLRYLAPRERFVTLSIFVAVVTMALVAVVVAKGERPVGWRWGNADGGRHADRFNQWRRIALTTACD